VLIPVDVSERDIAVLLLPRTLEEFILREQAEDLLKASGVIAVEPPRVPYGAFGRLPLGVVDSLGAGQAKRLKLPGRPKVVVMFHPLQWPLARALLAREPGSELWYGRWDRYEHAYDASPKLRARLERLHAEAAERAAVVFVASEALARLERDAGREPELLGLAAGSFPAPDPGEAVIAVSLGHQGHRNDWGLLRAVATRMPELIVLLVGEEHPEEMTGDADFAAVQALDNVLFLGRRSDAEAARLILCADAGIVPFKREPFNDAGLPYRILKAARLGRRTVTPVLEGVLTWERAVIRADGPEEWVAALRGLHGARCAPDHELRAWALEQTAARVNRPLWERLHRLGIA
jgi:glycosyltransferase involved in cell wall biosynthesis